MIRQNEVKTNTRNLSLDAMAVSKVYSRKVVFRLLGYVFKFKRIAFLTLFGMAGYIATMIAQPLLIAWGISVIVTPDILGESSWNNIHIISLLFLLTCVGNMGFNYLQNISMARLGPHVLHELRTDMFIHLQKQSVEFFDRNEVGRIMSRVQNDVWQLQEFMEISAWAISDTVMLFFIAITMVIMNPELGLITLATAPILIVIALIWQRYVRVIFLQIRIAMSALNGYLQENIGGVRVAQSLNRQEINQSRFVDLNTSYLRRALRAAFLSSLMPPTVEILTSVAMVVVLIVGGNMVLDGSLQLGVLVAFLLYVLRFFEPIRTLAMNYTEFQRSMASGARIFQLLDLEPKMKDVPNAPALPPIRGSIKIDNVSFGYDTELEILHDVNLHIKQGETLAIVGLTGSGKTTLVALIARFYDVDSGSICIDGLDVRSIQKQSLGSQMSMVLQEPFLYSTTIKENIKFNHAEVTDEQIVAAAKVVGADEFITELENGYDTILQQGGGNLSVGQRQLISFARAVVADPKIIILDEATANIDSHTESLIQNAIKKVLHGRTSIVIAHRLSTITEADRIVVMENGSIKEIGNHIELLNLNGVYSKLYTLNFGEGIEL